MSARPTPPPRVLVVEKTPELQELFTLLLTEDGYEPHLVATLAEALERVDELTFCLILADLYTGASRDSFTAGNILRRRVQPTPIGLLTTQPISDDAARAAGFTFTLHLPFDVENFLSRVAVAGAHPLSAEQQCQAKTVERYFTAAETQDWPALADICTDDVVFYPPGSSLVTTTRRIHGVRAIREYFQTGSAYYTAIHFDDLLVYPRPKGLVAQYTSRWTTPDGTRQQAASTTFFHFEGDRIRQIGLWVNLARLKSTVHPLSMTPTG